MTFNDGGRATRAGRYAWDLFERTAATAAQTGIAYVIVESADWPAWLAVPIAAGAAVVKGWLARVSGNKDSASLAPGV